jgi:cytoskeletal protein CcmA (bactofilin family)
MWRKPEDSKPASPSAEVPNPARVDPPVRSVAGLTAEVVQPSGGIITSSLLIKGEIRGREDLYIDGEVQGTIHLSDGRVTVGPHGKISADVYAREVIVRGKVKGAVRGRERAHGRLAVEELHGSAIEEGAKIHRKVEITRGEDSHNTRPTSKAATSTSAGLQPLAVKAVGDGTS